MISSFQVSLDTRRRRPMPSMVVAVFLCVAVDLLLLVLDADFSHWFLIPVTACGVLVMRDAVDWIRGRLDLFDPVGVIGVLGVHFFYVAPLLHVGWDYWLWDSYWRAYLPEPSDWRVWVGLVACINGLGLLVYRIVWQRFATRNLKGPPSIRVLEPRRFAVLLISVLLISGLAQLLIYWRFGGLGGYIEAFETSKRESFRGFGVVFMISESFPVLAMMLFALFARRLRWARRWNVLLLALGVFFILALVFGGLRGSRSNTVWALFWAVGIVHFWIRPVPRKIVAAGLVLLFSFLYAYGFYKARGREGLQALTSQESRAQFEVETGRTGRRVLLGDLARSDVQAYVLYSVHHPRSTFKLGWGRTYLAALTLVVPRSIWPDRPVQKVKEGTEVFFGRDTYLAGRRFSSRIYGLLGEALLNFPSWMTPLAFIYLGLCVGIVSWLGRALAPGDARLLVLPFLVNLCFIVLVSDSTNTVYTLFKNGALPLGAVFLGSKVLSTRSRSGPRGQ